MAEKTSIKKFITKVVLPRVFKAAVWGIVTFLLVYYLPMLLYPVEVLPLEYSQLFYLFAAIVVFFVVVTKLFSGTILEHAFNVARALIMIIYFIYIFNGGIVSLALPIPETSANLTIDLRVFLAMFISVNLLALAKTMLQLTDFLANKTESSQLSKP